MPSLFHVFSLYDKQGEIDGTQKVRVWFSDTYLRTPRGWRYAFGQASLPLPKE